MNPRFRNWTLTLHRWTGLTVGLVIVMLAVTAAIIVFRGQLEPVVFKPLFAVGQCTSAAPLDAQMAAAQAAHPGAKVDDLRIRPRLDQPTLVRFLDKEMLYVDPCSGSVLGSQTRYTGVFGFPEKLHRFKFIEGEAGAIADGTITAIFLVVLIAGGLIVWWPPTLLALRSAMKFRPHLKGVALNLNLHNVIGAYTSVFLIIMTATALPISFEWVRDAIFTATGSPLKVAKPTTTPADGVKPVALEAQWQKALALVPNAREGVLRIPRKPRDAVEVFLVDRDAPHTNARSYAYFDRITGDLLKFTPYDQASLGFRLYTWVVVLHTGEFGGIVGQILFFLAVLGVPVMAYTGFASYLSRRFNRAPRTTPPIRMRVAGIRRETDEVKAFTLVAADGRKLPAATPGAHVSVSIPDGLTRQYSLVNGPDDDDAYHIAVKREPDSRGGSRVMHERIAEGDVLEITPPRNHFPLDYTAKHHLLVAGGIGITPLLSMARQLQAIGASWELQYFARSAGQAPFHEVLSRPEFSRKVTFHYAVDRDGLRPYLHGLLRERREGAHLYVCGPRPLMDLIEDIASTAWPPETIHSEFFSADPSASSGPRLPFEVTLARTQATFAIPAEKSILEVLTERGVRVPNSCSQGVCGTCVTGVLDGTPDHRDAFLSDKERKS